MKKLCIALIGVFCLGLTSCDVARLSIYSSEWTAYIDQNGFGNIALTVSGNADADIVTVRTFGDGVISEQALPLDALGNFNETVIISFTHEPDPSAAVSASTVITAEKGGSIESETLESGSLSYTAAQ